jgi:hypothetical protein
MFNKILFGSESLPGHFLSIFISPYLNNMLVKVLLLATAATAHNMVAPNATVRLNIPP